MPKITAEESIRVIKFIRDFMERSKRYREPHIELAKKSREMYENWQASGKSMIQRANLKLPFGFTVIETQIPQLVDIFCRDNQVITFVGQSKHEAEYEDIITDFHTSQLMDMNFFTKFPAYIKAMLLDGTAFAKVPYIYREGKVIRRITVPNRKTGELEVQKIEVTDTLYDGPDFEVIPIYDIFPDWSSTNFGDIQSMRGIVHRTYKSMDALKASGLYDNLNELSFSVSKKGNNAWLRPYYSADPQESSFQQLNDNPDASVKKAGDIEIWEYWGKYNPGGGDKFEEYLIVIANGDVVIRFTPNPYDYKFKPFVATPNFIRDNEFYGIPELLAVRSLIKEANALRNARLDNVNLSVNPMFIIDKSAGIDLRSLYSRPGGLILANDINGIRPLQLPDPSLSSISESSYIQQDIQNATALSNSTPVLSQLGRTFGRSATGVSFIQNFANNRYGLKARLLAWTCLQPLGKIMFLTNRQFVTNDTWLRRFDVNQDNPFVLVTPDLFNFNFKIMPQTDIDTGGVEGDMARMQAVAQIAQVFENSQPGSLKADVLLEALLRPLLGRRVRRFVRSADERAALQAQNLAVQQAINAAQGAAAPQPNAAPPPIMNPFLMEQ